MNIVRIARHYHIAYCRAAKAANPAAFKKNGEIRKNVTWNYTKEMMVALDRRARAYNLALSRGINLACDFVCGNSSYNF